MPNESNINGQITQVKIGDYYYNIKDAAVWNILQNMSDNTVTLHLASLSNFDWKVPKLKTSKQLENTSWIASDQYVNPIHINGFKIYLDKDGKIHYSYVTSNSTSSSGLQYTNSNFYNTPTKIAQCAMLPQYRIRLGMHGQGMCATLLLRRELEGNETGMDASAWNPNWSHPFVICGPSKISCNHIFTGTHSVQTGTRWFDRIIMSTAGNKGYAFKIGVVDYIPLNSNCWLDYTGSSARILFICQGYAEENIAPHGLTAGEYDIVENEHIEESSEADGVYTEQNIGTINQEDDNSSENNGNN